jgi:hypothetical protein
MRCAEADETRAVRVQRRNRREAVAELPGWRSSASGRRGGAVKHVEIGGGLLFAANGVHPPDLSMPNALPLIATIETPGSALMSLGRQLR